MRPCVIPKIAIITNTMTVPKDRNRPKEVKSSLFFQINVTLIKIANITHNKKPWINTNFHLPIESHLRNFCFSFSVKGSFLHFFLTCSAQLWKAQPVAIPITSININATGEKEPCHDPQTASIIPQQPIIRTANSVFLCSILTTNKFYCRFSHSLTRCPHHALKTDNNLKEGKKQRKSCWCT
jgi:hypothetical protein